MGVKRADRDGDVCGETDACGGLWVQATGAVVGTQRYICVAFAEAREAGRKLIEEGGGGETTPGSVVHRLVAGGADAAGHGVRIGVAGDGGDDEVAEFDP